MKVKYLGEDVELTFTHGAIYKVAGIYEGAYILWDDEDEPSDCPIGKLEVIEGDESEVCLFEYDAESKCRVIVREGSKENVQAWDEYDKIWHIFIDD